VVPGPPLRRATRRLELDVVTADAQHQRRLGPEEAEGAPAFRALHALEGEPVRSAMDLQERRDGRLEVGQDLTADGNQVAALAQRAKVLARRPRSPASRRRRGLERARAGGHSGFTTDLATSGRSRAGRDGARASVARGSLLAWPEGRGVAVPRFAGAAGDVCAARDDGSALRAGAGRAFAGGVEAVFGAAVLAGRVPGVVPVFAAVVVALVADVPRPLLAGVPVPAGRATALPLLAGAPGFAIAGTGVAAVACAAGMP